MGDGLEAGVSDPAVTPSVSRIYGRGKPALYSTRICPRLLHNGLRRVLGYFQDDTIKSSIIRKNMIPRRYME